MKVERPTRFFHLLCSEETGLFARADAGAGGGVSFGRRADDAACWELSGSAAGSLRLTSPGAGDMALVLTPAAAASGRGPRAGEQGVVCSVRSAGGGEVGDGGRGVFRLLRGPAELPSVSVAHIREHGYVVLPELIHPDTVADLKRNFTQMMGEKPPHPSQKRVGLPNILNRTPSVAKTTTHPVAMLILEEYIRSPLHLGHPPATGITRSQDPSYKHYGKNTEYQSTADKGGWHSDYPFSSPQGPNLDELPPGVCFGCEFLTCVDEFTELNGATMFVPGSHRFGRRPPPAAQRAHPAGAESIEAPAGTVVIFDSKTWHRSHWNRSGADRCAMLNNVLPRWVMPMAPHDAEYGEFVRSGRADEWLTPRERADAKNIMRARWGSLHGGELPGFSKKGSRYFWEAGDDPGAAAPRL